MSYNKDTRMAHIVLGTPVRGKDLYGREDLIASIWTRLQKGNILLASPRRFGKTSVMLNLRDKPQCGFKAFYLDTEWIKGPADFITELITELIKENTIQHGLRTVKTLFKDAISNINEVGLAECKIKLRHQLQHEWQEAGKELIRVITRLDEKIVILVDEFPLMVRNMTKENQQEAYDFVHWFRGIRNLPEALSHVRFVIGGSIGIEGVLSKIDAIASINDLERIQTRPFPDEVARSFVKELFDSENHPLSEEVSHKILELIEIHVPYFIQMLVTEAMKEARNCRAKITTELLERVYKERALGVECRSYFQHYYVRLKDLYDPEEEKVAKIEGGFRN